jgi:hypothetical protein
MDTFWLWNVPGVFGADCLITVHVIGVLVFVQHHLYVLVNALKCQQEDVLSWVCSGDLHFALLGY